MGHEGRGRASARSNLDHIFYEIFRSHVRGRSRTATARPATSSTVCSTATGRGQGAGTPAAGHRQVTTSLPATRSFRATASHWRISSSTPKHYVRMLKRGAARNSARCRETARPAQNRDLRSARVKAASRERTGTSRTKDDRSSDRPEPPPRWRPTMSSTPAPRGANSTLFETPEMKPQRARKPRRPRGKPETDGAGHRTTRKPPNRPQPAEEYSGQGAEAFEIDGFRPVARRDAGCPPACPPDIGCETFQGSALSIFPPLGEPRLHDRLQRRRPGR